MKLKYIITFFLLLLITFPVLSKMRRASILSLNDLTTPFSPSYVPHPYPDTETKIIEDLRYGIEKVFANGTATFQYSLDKTSNPLPKLLQRNSSMMVQKIVKVENRIAEMTDPFSYLVIIFDKETNEYARVAMTADGLLHSFAVVSPRAHVKPLKSEKEIIALLTNKASVRSAEISNVNLMAYGVLYASPVCPFYQVTFKDESIYFIDYNENIFIKNGEKALKGDVQTFIDKEKTQLKKGENILYDSLEDKLLILKPVSPGGVQ